MSLYFINVETIEKCKNDKKKFTYENFTSSADEFQLHQYNKIGKCSYVKAIT